MANGKKYPRQWEPINGTLQRLMIPGGWLIRSNTTLILGNKEVFASEDMTVINDEHFDWNLEEK